MDPRRNSEIVAQGVKVNTHSDRNLRKGGYARNALPGNSDNFELHFFLDV